MIKCIFAMGPSGEFGYKGGLPWGYCKEDLKHFAAYTKDHCVVMGKGTWESLPPSKLQGRMCYVVDRGEKETYDVMDDHVAVKTKDFRQFLVDLNNVASQSSTDVIVIGGLELILQAMEVVEEVSVNIVGLADYYDCDKKIPEEFVQDLYDVVFEAVSPSVDVVSAYEALGKDDSDQYLCKYIFNMKGRRGVVLRATAKECIFISEVLNKQSKEKGDG